MIAPARLLSAALLFAAVIESSQGAAVKPCEAPEFRQFDFWVGAWEVRDAAGEIVGRNIISLEQNGCAVLERWTAANGGTGMSLNHYDPIARAWKQHWIGMGTSLEMSGTLENGVMTLEGPLHYVAEKRTTILRGVWTPLPDGSVRQRFTESSDDGKTWTEWFDGYYSRIRPSQ